MNPFRVIYYAGVLIVFAVLSLGVGILLLIFPDLFVDENAPAWVNEPPPPPAEDAPSPLQIRESARTHRLQEA